MPNPLLFTKIPIEVFSFKDSINFTLWLFDNDFDFLDLQIHLHFNPDEITSRFLLGKSFQCYNNKQWTCMKSQIAVKELL